MSYRHEFDRDVRDGRSLTTFIRERSLFMGLTEVMWAIAGAIGPIMGGAFTQTIGWR